eukprot:gene14137-14256_t
MISTLSSAIFAKKSNHAGPIFAPAGVGDDFRWIQKVSNYALESMISYNQAPIPVVNAPQEAPDMSLEHRLYQSKAAGKLRTAAIAMHLDGDWRQRFFAQIDNLLDVDEWDPNDTPITDGSFGTFLRMILLVKAKRRPGMGATSNGHAVASWTVGNDRLTIECAENDCVNWSDGLRMKHDKLPSDSHVIRYVPWAKLRKDEDDKVIGVNWDAFQMRAVDNDLSITWAGYFTGLKPTQIEAALALFLKPARISGIKSGLFMILRQTIMRMLALHGYRVMRWRYSNI